MVAPLSSKFRPGDEWDQFCVDAGNSWARVTGDTAKAAEMQNTCIEKNQKLPCSTFLSPPWTVVGLGCRGLPVNFSSSDAKTKAGITGALISAGQDAVDIVNNPTGQTTQPTTSTSQPTTTPVVVPLTGTTIGTMVLGGSQGLPQIRQSTRIPDKDFDPSALLPEDDSTKMILGLGAVAVLGFLLLRGRGGSMAGFGGYSSKRRRRARKMRRVRR